MMFSDLSEVDFIVEVHSEQARMVVRALKPVAVFAASVIAEGAFLFSETFEEFLEVCRLETPKFGKVLIVVRECDEAILRMERGLVNAALCPFCGFRQAALHALSARDV